MPAPVEWGNALARLPGAQLAGALAGWDGSHTVGENAVKLAA